MRTIAIALLLLLAGQAAAQTSSASSTTKISFRIPLQIVVGSITDTLYFGVNPDNTVGIDDNVALGEYLETQAPPLPPPPFPYDARFITLPGRVNAYPTGLGTGTFTDYRPYASPSQVDSFLVYFQGENVKTTDITLSWPAGLGQYSDQWEIRPYLLDYFPVTDMLQNTSVVVPASAPFKQVLIIKSGLAVSVEQPKSAIPAHMTLRQNYPNPFNPSTLISFALARTSDVRLDVFNLLGQKVRTIVNTRLNAGVHSVTFEAGDLESGMYFYRLTAGGNSIARKMTLIR
jgi:hypothetical protein